MKTVLVPGTWAWHNSDLDRAEWWAHGSPFTTFLRAQGVDIFETSNGDSFVWSTGIGGVGRSSRKLLVWAAAGHALFQFCVPPRCPERRIPKDALNLVAHSHGLQAVLFACGEYGLKVRTLISVGSPVRKDMAEMAAKARPNIARWLHLYSDETDKMQWLGELFDGHWGITRQHPLADANDFMPAGHSAVLNDPTLFHWWTERRWVEWLTQGA